MGFSCGQGRRPGDKAMGCAANVQRATTAHPAVPLSPPPQGYVTEDAWKHYGCVAPLEPGMLTHLTRVTHLRLIRGVQLPNDPAALPSAGASLRVLEMLCDARDELPELSDEGSTRPPEAPIEALLPVAPGLEVLDIHESCLTAADAARLAAALPRGMARLQIGTRDKRVSAALPMTNPEPRSLPADPALPPWRRVVREEPWLLVTPSDASA
jgi:hypothetical protein